MQRFLADEAGVVLTSEIALVEVVGVLVVSVGLNAASSAVNSELNDFACAIGSLNQSFSYRSSRSIGHGWVAGSEYRDQSNFGDCAPIRRRQPLGQSLTGAVVSDSVIVGTVPVVLEPIIQPFDRF